MSVELDTLRDLLDARRKLARDGGKLAFDVIERMGGKDITKDPEAVCKRLLEAAASFIITVEHMRRGGEEYPDAVKP